MFLFLICLVNGIDFLYHLGLSMDTQAIDNDLRFVEEDGQGVGLSCFNSDHVLFWNFLYAVSAF